MAYRKVDEEILQQVRGIISDDKRILTEKQDLIGYSYDASFGVFLPELVIQPTTAQEVAAVVKLAYEETIPVYPRGQSTSLSGGPLPVEGGIVLDLSHMNKKLEVVPKVFPGDIIVADHDGIVVVPQTCAAQVFEGVLKKVDGENAMRKALQQGMGIVEAYKKYNIL